MTYLCGWHSINFWLLISLLLPFDKIVHIPLTCVTFSANNKSVW